VRDRNRRNHALGHLVGRHPKLGMGAGDHDVQSAEQILALIQGTVVEYVYLDPNGRKRYCLTTDWPDLRRAHGATWQSLKAHLTFLAV
jgi:hypothetical protein